MLLSGESPVAAVQPPGSLAGQVVDATAGPVTVTAKAETNAGEDFDHWLVDTTTTGFVNGAHKDPILDCRRALPV